MSDARGGYSGGGTIRYATTRYNKRSRDPVPGPRVRSASVRPRRSARNASCRRSKVANHGGSDGSDASTSSHAHVSTAPHNASTPGCASTTLVGIPASCALVAASAMLARYRLLKTSIKRSMERCPAPTFSPGDFSDAMSSAVCQTGCPEAKSLRMGQR